MPATVKKMTGIMFLILGLSLFPSACKKDSVTDQAAIDRCTNACMARASNTISAGQSNVQSALSSSKRPTQKAKAVSNTDHVRKDAVSNSNLMKCNQKCIRQAKMRGAAAAASSSAAVASSQQ